MGATLKLTHKAIGAEVRRGTYDVLLDRKRVGSVEMNHTFETPIEPGRHTLQVRNGRNSSRKKTFDAAESETIVFRCTGKSILPVFLLPSSSPVWHFAPSRIGVSLDQRALSDSPAGTCWSRRGPDSGH